MVSNAFNYEGKCEFDLNFVEVAEFITQKLELRTRPEFLYEEEFRKRD